MPSMPFSLCRLHVDAVGNIVRDQRRNADAEIDVKAVAQFLRGARGHLFAGPGHQTFSPAAAGDGSRLRRGALFDALLGGSDLDDALHENAGRMDVVRIDLAGRHQVLDLGHRDLRRRRHHRVEIARGLAIDEIACGIALPGMDHGDVGEQAAFHEVLLAIEFLHFLALGDQGADAGLGEEGGNAGAAGADAFGQRALRVEFQLQLAGEEIAARKACSRRHRTRSSS